MSLCIMHGPALCPTAPEGTLPGLPEPGPTTASCLPWLSWATTTHWWSRTDRLLHSSSGREDGGHMPHGRCVPHPPCPPTAPSPASALWGLHSHHQTLPPKVNAKEKGSDLNRPSADPLLLSQASTANLGPSRDMNSLSPYSQ